MKRIAIVTNDEETISPHFGRATKYLVATIEDGQVKSSEIREKVSHRDFHRGEGHSHGHHNDPRGRGFGQHSDEKRQRMFASIADCQAMIARGMGQGAYQGLKQMGIQPILTDIEYIDAALTAVLSDTIEDHPERLH